ncbi:MAG: hypothetical protein J5I81_12720 [Nitrococcus mobilis]|nr:hypothetical protein [Nitrococcus mobilis]
MMVVAALLAVVLGGFGVASAQLRSFDFDQRRFIARAAPFWGEGRPRRSGSVDHADHYGSARSERLAPGYAPRDRLISPAEAARRAQQRYGGRVLGVELARDGAPYYRVKLLRNGNVRVVRIPAGR